MKKDDLKAAFGKIQPSEELIRKTILAVQDKKYGAREVRRHNGYGFAFKLAGAVCAFALVFVMGFVAARHGLDSSITEETPKQRMVTVEGSGDHAPMTINFEPESGAYSADTQWVAVKGEAVAFRFLEKSGECSNAAVTVVVEKTEGKSDTFVPQSIPEEISANATFEDKDILNRFIDCMSDDMLFYLVLNEDGSWTLADFEIFE